MNAGTNEQTNKQRKAKEIATSKKKNREKYLSEVQKKDKARNRGRYQE